MSGGLQAGVLRARWARLAVEVGILPLERMRRDERVGRWRWGHCGWRVCAEGGAVGAELMRAWAGA